MSTSDFQAASEIDAEAIGVETLLASVQSGRPTVQRALEYVRGERSACQLKGTDYLAAMNHVRRDLDVTLTLYGETPSTPGVSAWACGRFGAIEYAGWNGHQGMIHRFVDHEKAADMLHRTRREIVTVDEARERFQAFVREHCDDLEAEDEIVTDGGVELVPATIDYLDMIGADCPVCDEELTPGSLRWSGTWWEHKSREAHPQAGHHQISEAIDDQDLKDVDEDGLIADGGQSAVGTDHSIVWNLSFPQEQRSVPIGETRPAESILAAYADPHSSQTPTTRSDCAKLFTHYINTWPASLNLAEHFYPFNSDYVRQCRLLYADTEREVATDGGRDVSRADGPVGRASGDGDTNSGSQHDAFLGDDIHLCELCRRVFRSTDALANHLCRPVEGGDDDPPGHGKRTEVRGGVPTVVSGSPGVEVVHGPDPTWFEAQAGDSR